MDTYDEKSCSVLEKPYYRPIEAALRWCNLTAHEVEILQITGASLLPPAHAFPQWPCLKANAEKILDAIQNSELTKCREGRTVAPGDSVAKENITVRHSELKEWMAKHYPDQKPAFLFDAVERTTHTTINADAFRALQVDRDAARSELEKMTKVTKDISQKYSELQHERDSLAAMVEKINPLIPRAETTYLNIIGGLLFLMLGKSPAGKAQSVFDSQAAIISALLAHHGGKSGIADSTLENKFAEANRSLNAN